MVVKKCYPGWTRKAITFTIDDGNIEMDRKFISIVKPFGIKGTFNLCSPKLNQYTKDFYRDFYAGFGISNHCKWHPYLLKDAEKREYSNEKFDISAADENKLYKAGIEGVYHIHVPKGWRKTATLDAYCKLISDCHSDLEAVFGEGSVTTFVWPFGDQGSEDVLSYISRELGYTAARKAGAIDDSTGFAVPDKRMYWSYNASHKNLLECAEKYDSYADDGELKLFSVGVHSIDYENENRWDDLRKFAEKYGNRSNDFYYASVEDVFRYADAANKLKITENSVENPSNLDIYLEIDGEKKIIRSGKSVKIN